MDNTPNVSDVINLIMQNPEMLNMIKNLAASSGSQKSEDDVPETESAAMAKESPTDIQSDTVRTSASATESIDRGARRKHLLCALKPYVSESRAQAIDSLLGFSELFEVIKRG